MNITSIIYIKKFFLPIRKIRFIHVNMIVSRNVNIGYVIMADLIIEIKYKNNSDEEPLQGLFFHGINEVVMWQRNMS